MNHMKRFFAYMFLACIVYLIIYAALIGYMRMSSTDIRDFCEQIEPGVAQETLETLAQQQGFKSAVSQLPDDQGHVIFISSPENSEATCQGIFKDKLLTEKKFVLSVF